jgi:hypothetical protein
MWLEFFSIDINNLGTVLCSIIFLCIRLHNTLYNYKSYYYKFIHFILT